MWISERTTFQASETIGPKVRICLAHSNSSKRGCYGWNGINGGGGVRREWKEIS